jgi:hypothetical protein
MLALLVVFGLASVVVSRFQLPLRSNPFAASVLGQNNRCVWLTWLIKGRCACRCRDTPCRAVPQAGHPAQHRLEASEDAVHLGRTKTMLRHARLDSKRGMAYHIGDALGQFDAEDARLAETATRAGGISAGVDFAAYEMSVMFDTKAVDVAGLTAASGSVQGYFNALDVSLAPQTAVLWVEFKMLPLASSPRQCLLPVSPWLSGHRRHRQCCGRG